ncbi:hypothetical protein ACGFX4_22495 [Kitasatospora sp. NPDC048365]|uniref:hypothetical protein n=1 Tax=Kitasatospora sp. NPDC048365 TaxID=3364050 RepID=UPI0037247F0C
MWTNQALIDALTSGDPDRAGRALTRLARHPRELAALDDRIRRVHRWDAHAFPQLTAAETAVRRGQADRYAW